jgi:hypothetical protein
MERVLSDNGNGYRSHAWATACAELVIAPPLHPAEKTRDQRQGGRRSSRRFCANGRIASLTSVSTPPYIFGRPAILMLGSHLLLIPGIALLTFAAMLHSRRQRARSRP